MNSLGVYSMVFWCVNLNFLSNKFLKAPQRMNRLAVAQEETPKVLNLHEWDTEAIDRHAVLIRDAMQPGSKYYDFMRHRIEPVVIKPLIPRLTTSIPFVGSSVIEWRRLELRNLVPSAVKITPVPGSDYKLEIEIDFERIEMEFDIAMEHGLHWNEDPAKKERLQIAATATKAKITATMYLAMAPPPKRKRFFYQKRQYARYALSYLRKGKDGIKERFFRNVYDAEIESASLDYDKIKGIADLSNSNGVQELLLNEILKLVNLEVSKPQVSKAVLHGLKRMCETTKQKYFTNNLRSNEI